MSLFTAASLLESARMVKLANRQNIYATAKSILLNASNSTPIEESFDIFLSHSFLDADIVLGLKKQIEEMGHSVYVDWVTDKELERSEASKETAALLKKRMLNSKSLFFATSSNSGVSKWMPWECGFFDGKKENKVAICPISLSGTTDTYKGQEYLALYPYVCKNTFVGGTKEMLWIYETPTKYMIFDAWLNGLQPTQR